MANTSCPVAAAALLLAASVSAQTGQNGDTDFDWGERTTSYPPSFDEQFRAPIVATPIDLDVETVVSGVVYPWAIENLPGDSGYLVTERTGTVRHLTSNGELSAPLSGTPEVHNEQQGGMLDVETGPNFADDRMVYLSYSKPTGTNADGNTMSATAVGRGRLADDFSAIEGFEDIWVQEPPAPEPLHYGSRIAFDEEGHVFITTGERFTFENRPLAQQLGTTLGKTIRVHPDGSIPEDNPFVDNPEADDSIWSYGHRNIEGAQVVDGQLVVLEMGPQGGDEINRIEPGQNYGWPLVSYGERYEQFGGEPVGTGQATIENAVEPIYFWDPVIAPSDFVVYEGDMFQEWEGDYLISALVAGGLVRISLGEDGRVEAEERLLSDVGHTRDVEVDDDGSLLLATDQEDGRILRVSRP